MLSKLPEGPVWQPVCYDRHYILHRCNAERTYQDSETTIAHAAETCRWQHDLACLANKTCRKGERQLEKNSLLWGQESGFFTCPSLEPLFNQLTLYCIYFLCTISVWGSRPLEAIPTHYLSAVRTHRDVADLAAGTEYSTLPLLHNRRHHLKVHGMYRPRR